MNPKVIERYTPLARELAATNNRPNRHVSMIFRQGRLLPDSIGMNLKRRTHTLAAKHNYLFDNLHSEMDSYRRIRYRFEDDHRLVLVNWSFNNALALKMSRPCELCLPWCATIFHRIWYSTGNGNEFLRV